MTNNEALDFLGRCIAAGYGSDADAIRKTADRHLTDWHLVTYYADKHLIIPTLYNRLSKNNLLSILPEELSVHFEAIFKMNRDRNIVLRQQALEIVALLNAEGIMPVFMKGTANVLDGLYEDEGERIVGDIDFLVSDDEFLRTAEILQNNGYQYKEQYSYMQIDIKKVKHFPRLYKQGTTFDVEIHRVPVKLEYSAHFNYQVIEPELKLLTGNNLRYYVCSDRHKVVMAFIHGQLNDHGAYYGFVNFRNCYEMIVLNQRVDVAKTLSEFGYYPQHANNYLTMINLRMGIKPAFAVRKTFAGKVFMIRNQINAKSATLYAANTRILYSTKRFYETYIKIVLKAMVSAKYRKYLWIRLSNPKWYKEHWDSWVQKL